MGSLLTTNDQLVRRLTRFGQSYVSRRPKGYVCERGERWADPLEAEEARPEQPMTRRDEWNDWPESKAGQQPPEARAIDALRRAGYVVHKNEGECYAAPSRGGASPTEDVRQAVRDIKRMEKINPPYAGLVMNDPDAGL